MSVRDRSLQSGQLCIVEYIANRKRGQTERQYSRICIRVRCGLQYSGENSKVRSTVECRVEYNKEESTVK